MTRNARTLEARDRQTPVDGEPARNPAESGTVALKRPDTTLMFAHDLKTPLATIGMNMEYALGALEGTAFEAVRVALEDSLAANARALRIVSDMAETARVARRAPRLADHPTDVGPIVEDVVRSLKEEAAARRVIVTSRCDGSTTRGDASLLGRALERLLEWTLRHASAGGEVEIDCIDRVVSFQTRSSAPGANEPPHAALATYFAETVLRAQGGGVWTEVDEEGWLRVTVALPL